jgi:hypothetical protein
MHSEPYDEVRTEIYPTTALNAVESEIEPYPAIEDPQVSIPAGQGDASAPLVRPAYFGLSDATAWSAADLIPLQTADALSDSIRKKINEADVSVSRRFRVETDGLL